MASAFWNLFFHHRSTEGVTSVDGGTKNTEIFELCATPRTRRPTVSFGTANIRILRPTVMVGTDLWQREPWAELFWRKRWRTAPWGEAACFRASKRHRGAKPFTFEPSGALCFSLASRLYLADIVMWGRSQYGSMVPKPG